MQDPDIKKAFGSRIKSLRKQRGWSQKQLAIKINMGAPLLNKYECGLHSPPLEKLLIIAEALETTMDYLVVGTLAENSPINDTRLLKRFHELEGFGSDDKEMVIKLIDAVIAKRRMENALDPL